MVAALPLAREATDDPVEGGLVRWGIGDGEGFAASLLEEFAVAKRIGDVEAEGAGLASAKEFAWTAKFEIGFGDLETVGCTDHSIEAGAGLIGHAQGADQDAVRFC